MFNRYSSLFITAFSPSKQASPNSKHASPHHYFPCDPSQNPRSYPHISQCFLYITIGSPEPLDDLLSETIALPKTPNLSSHTLPTLSAIQFGPDSMISGSPGCHALAAAGSFWITLENPFTWLVSSCLSFRPQLTCSSTKKASYILEVGLRVLLHIPCDDSITLLTGFLFSKFISSVSPRDSLRS